MEKGFTLIELLAVIVILAIIALIATPIILNIIGNAKNESNERTKELYLDAVKDAIARKNLTEEFNPSECTVQKDGNLKCEGKNLQVEVNGTKPCSGKITFDKKGKITNETVKYCDGSEEDIVYSVLNKEAYIYISEGITKLEFLPNGKIPEGMSKEEFLALDSVIGNNLSNDGKIYGYYGGEKYCPYQEDDEEYVCDEYEYVYKNGTLYIYSENGIRLPEDSSHLMKMFDFYEDLEQIIFNDVDTSMVKNMSYMFESASYEYKNLDLSNFDTSSVTDMSYMFSNVVGIIDLSNFDTSSVTNMSHMFDGEPYGYISEIKFGENFDTSNVTDMSYMFSNQQDLKELDLSAFNTSNVQNMSHMFDGVDYGLAEIKFGKNFNTSEVTDMSYMFSDCYSLKELDLSSFDTHNVKNYENMFSGFAYDYSMGDGSFEGTIYISDKWTLPESLLSSANASHYTLKN